MADGKSSQGFFGCFLFQQSDKLAALRWRESCHQSVADEADKFLFLNKFFGILKTCLDVFLAELWVVFKECLQVKIVCKPL